MKLFGQKLKTLRTREGLLQIDLAKEFGVSDSTVTRWENGDQEPSMEMILKICDYFKTTPNYLFGFE